ncbi:hypothetical protein N8556_00345 [bacterium]|nr:hypothetical protein [bacterium]
MGDGGIENFKPRHHLARETSQNVIDARDDDSRPAKIVFSTYELPSDEVPGADFLRRILAACLEAEKGRNASDRDPGSAEQLLERAVQLMQSESAPLKVLKIADYNTTGLEGDDLDENSRWYRLLRGQGSSSSEGAGGGTFGIGQRAPFAFSELRVVFYSTMRQDGTTRFMGKFILRGCEHPTKGKKTQNVGYFGVVDDAGEGVSGADVQGDVPEVFRRDRPGTDIHVLGFSRDDLGEAVRDTILTDFFAAIAAGLLEVEVRSQGGEADRITSGNIEDLLAHESTSAARNKHGNSESRGQIDMREALHALRALKEEPATAELEGLGTVCLHVHLTEDARERWITMRRPRTVVERNGSKILRGYQAVLIVESKEGNDLLARLEDPKHEKWDLDQFRGNSVEQRTAARKALRGIRRFVTATLRGLRNDHSQDDYSLPGLSEFLPLEDDAASSLAPGQQQPEGGDAESPDRTPPHKDPEIIPKGPRKPPTINRPDDGDGAGDEGGITGGGNSGDGGGKSGESDGENDGEGSGPHGGSDPGGRVLTRRHVRFRSWRSGAVGSGTYQLSLSSQGGAMNGEIRLASVGESGRFPVDIKSARDLDSEKQLTVKGDRIEGVNMGVTGRCRIELSVDAPIDLSLDLEGGS